MLAIKRRRSSLARLSAGPRTAARRRPLASRLLLLDALESRILLAGTPNQLLFIAQPTQTAALSPMTTSVQVEIADSLGQLTADTSTVQLTIVQGPGGATIDNATAVSVSAVFGIAAFDNLTFSAAGTYTLRATDGSLRSASSNTFTITPPANQLNFQHPIPTLIAGIPFTTTVEVDSAGGLGNPVTTDRSTVTLTVSSGPFGGNIIGTTVGTPVNGVITFSGLSLPTAGTYRISVTDGSLAGAVSNAFIVQAGAPAGVTFATQPSSTPVSGSITPAITVNFVDSFGNVVTTDTNTVTLSIFSGTPTVGTLSGTTSVAAINGVATFPGLSINTAGAYVLQAAGSSFTANSNSFNITGPADHVAFLNQPGTTPGNEPITPGLQIAVEDALNHIIVGDTSSITLTLNAGPGTLSGTTTVQAINGVATFSDLSINAAGSYQLTATDSLLTAATSNTFSVGAPAVALTFAQGPGNVAANSVLFPSIVVDLLAADGSLVVTNTSAITLALINGPAGGSMNGNTTVNAIAGQATFDNLTFTKQGVYTLLAYDGNLVTETSVDFTVTPAAAKLAFATQPVTTSMAGITLHSFSVRVTDASGNIVPTDQSNVTLSINGPSGATIGGTTTVSAINGIATFSDIVLTVAGKYTFLVNDGALGTGSSTPITITPDLVEVPDLSHPGMLLNPTFIVSSATTSTLTGKTLPAVSVLMEDMFHNIITTVNTGNATVQILTGHTLTLNGTLTAKFAQGVASFKNLSINTAGNYTLGFQVATTIPASTPYPVTGTLSQMTLITPVVNSMRAPAHSTNYAFGATITLNTNVGSLVTSSGIPYIPGPALLITAAGATIETGTVSATGAVNFHFNDLAPGGYDVYIAYDGDINHTGARSPIFLLNVGATVTTLTASATTVNSGNTLTLTATVKNALTSQLLTSGNVEFFETGNAVPLATIAISAASTHTAAFPLIPTAGTHSYFAVFVANASLSTSTSLLKLITVT